MKLNFITDHGSILEITSCASRAASPPCLADLGASCGDGLLTADLLLTLTGDLPLPIAPPGFRAAVGLSLFFFPGREKGLAILGP